ncbi:MAG: phosphatidylglycerophosphatase A [Planctomycetes bacterium]|nr:phosphatidylglycerophosphatase A [Planctomycetota bacterium]
MREFLATGFYFGRSPIIPGTFGTLPAVALHILCACLLRDQPRLLLGAALLLLALAASAASVWLGGWAQERFGKQDPRPFVLDEIAGYLVTVAFVAGHPLWQCAIGGFILFRAMDVLKPFPCRPLERIPRGWGILLDDIVAGLYANFCLRLALYWLG